MKSLDRNSLEEQTRLVSRYVAGDLSRSERAEFEAWLVASPELAAEVEMERRLRRGIASAARRGWLKRSAPVERAARPPAGSSRLAASVLVSRRPGLSVLLPRETTVVPARIASPSAGQRVAASRTVRLSNVRGADGVPDSASRSPTLPASW